MPEAFPASRTAVSGSVTPVRVCPMSISTSTPIGRSREARPASASTPASLSTTIARSAIFSRAATRRRIVAGAVTRRRHQDPVEPGRRHRLRLAHRGAAEADRARLQLTARNLRRLVRLDVRAQLSAVPGDHVRHGPQVRLEGVQIEQQSRRRQLALVAHRADQRFVRTERHVLLPPLVRLTP